MRIWLFILIYLDDLFYIIDVKLFMKMYNIGKFC